MSLENFRRQVSRAGQLTNLQNVVRPEAGRRAEGPLNRLVERAHLDEVEASHQLLRLGEGAVHDVALAIGYRDAGAFAPQG